MSLDWFWQIVDKQLDQLRDARTVAQVLALLPTEPGMSSGDGFFTGSGGDVGLLDVLPTDAWTLKWAEAGYFWCATDENGDPLTYIEGDLFAGDQRPLPANA